MTTHSTLSAELEALATPLACAAHSALDGADHRQGLALSMILVRLMKLANDARLHPCDHRTTAAAKRYQMQTLVLLKELGP
jgi:hypothetical protein